MKKLLYLVGAIIVIGAIIFIFGRPSETSAPRTAETNVAGAIIPSPDQNSTVLPQDVIYTNDGFSPRSLAASAGASVAFKNNSSRGVWIATNPHPVHTGYPGSDIKNCESDAAMFDSCRVLNPGESWSFTFIERGAWGYHNHLQSGQTGTIIVE